MTDVISGIKIPDSKIAREAAELVRQHETEMLFNHSVRVFIFGAMEGIRQISKYLAGHLVLPPDNVGPVLGRISSSV